MQKYLTGREALIAFANGERIMSADRVNESFHIKCDADTHESIAFYSRENTWILAPRRFTWNQIRDFKDTRRDFSAIGWGGPDVSIRYSKELKIFVWSGMPSSPFTPSTEDTNSEWLEVKK